MSTFSNIFFSETTGPIEAKLEPPWDGERKFVQSLFGPSHMTKMAVMPIYGKNLKKSIFFSRTKRLMILNLGMQYRVLEYYQVC